MSRGEFFQKVQISPENMAKLKRYKEEVMGLSKIPIICPRCGKVADRVYSDATGHKDIRCYYCKMEFVSSLPQFRSIWKRKKKEDRELYCWW